MVSETYFLEKFTRVACSTFSEPNLGNMFESEPPVAQLAAEAARAFWHQISEFGEWRFERKCFRANIETSAAKTRRSIRISFFIFVGEVCRI